MLGSHLPSTTFTVAATAAVHVCVDLITCRSKAFTCFAAYPPKEQSKIDRKRVMEIFLAGRPDRAWLSSIVGPRGSLVDLCRHV